MYTMNGGVDCLIVMRITECGFDYAAHAGIALCINLYKSHQTQAQDTGVIQLISVASAEKAHNSI